jgi:hypothetical protein
MTEEEAFQELVAEALNGFGWTVTPEEVGSYHDIETVLARIINWGNTLDKDTLDLLGDFDLAPGMWAKGWLSEWPLMYTLMSNSTFSRFRESLDDIRLSILNARGRAPDYAAQHAVGRLEDDPAFAAEVQP